LREFPVPIDAELFRDAVRLFKTQTPDAVEAAQLAQTLDVVEEILPWLSLRAGAFAEHEEIELALRTAAKRATSAKTIRAAGTMNGLSQHKAERELDTALEALIRDNVERQELAHMADARLAELVRMSEAGQQVEPQNRVAVEMLPHQATNFAS
jgi:hypothetical protein